MVAVMNETYLGSGYREAATDSSWRMPRSAVCSSSLGSVWPCTAMACCTDAARTSSSSPEMVSVQPTSFGKARQSTVLRLMLGCSLLDRWVEHVRQPCERERK